MKDGVADGQAWKWGPSLLPIFPWLEATHKTIPYCKGAWDMWSSCAQSREIDGFVKEHSSSVIFRLWEVYI